MSVDWRNFEPNSDSKQKEPILIPGEDIKNADEEFTIAFLIVAVVFSSLLWAFVF